MKSSLWLLCEIWMLEETESRQRNCLDINVVILLVIQVSVATLLLEKYTLNLFLFLGTQLRRIFQSLCIEVGPFN